MNEYVTKFLSFDDFEVETKKDGSLAIAGYGNVFLLQDLHGDVVERGVFKESLSKNQSSIIMPKMLYEHNEKHCCGVWIDANEDDYGLKMKGVVFKSEKEIIQNILNGKVSGLSIGFYLLESHMKNDVRYITKLKLKEVSLVSRPANQYSRFVPRDHRVEHPGRTRSY